MISDLQKSIEKHKADNPELAIRFDIGSAFFKKAVCEVMGNEHHHHNTLMGGESIEFEYEIGKTTFLQKIAEWVLEVTDDIPIWINLGALGKKSIREYLLEDWLRDASQSLDHAPAVWTSIFEEYLREGKVWLFLDGVDEMGVENPLHHLALQFDEGWAKNVRIVLTCRLNAWEPNKNELEGYDPDKNNPYLI